MKRTLLIFASLCFIATTAMSQSLLHDWNALIGTDGEMDDENLVEVFTNAAGEYYVLGKFLYSTNFGFPGSVETVDLGNYSYSGSTFIAKYQADGTPLGVGLFLGLDHVQGGQITSTEIVLIGTAYDTLSIDGTGYNVKQYGQSLNVMIRMDLDGNITSVVPLTVPGYNNQLHPSGAEFLPNGDFVLYGGVSDTTLFNGSATPIEINRSTLFISRFNTSGEEVWTTLNTYLDPENDINVSAYADEMKADVNGNIWLSASIFSQYGFDIGGITIPGSSSYGPLFLKMDPSDGSVLWADKGVEPKDGFLYFSNMFPTEDGGMLYAGDIFGSSAVIQGIIRSLGTVSMFEGNIIMVKFTAEGVVDWFRLIPIGFSESEQMMDKGSHRSETKSDDGLGIYARTSNGDLIMGAPLGQDLNLDGISVLRDENYNFSGVMLRIDVNRGTILWGHALHANSLEANDLEVDVNDNIWLPGSFVGNAVLDAGITLIDETSITKKVGFLSVYDGDGMLKAKKIIYPDIEANFPDISLLAVKPDPSGEGAVFLGDIQGMYNFDETQVVPTQNYNRFLTHFKLESMTANSADSTVLVNFYDNSNGPNWQIHTNWKTGPLDTWYGVQMENGRVVALALDNNNINSPASLSGLSELKALSLKGNAITDVSGLSLASLTKLRFLNLSENALTSFPTDVFETTSLEGVNLDKNQIAGSLPATISNLVNLKSLKASGNQISGSLPTELGTMSSLISLDLSNNQITGTIPSVSGLSSLYALDLSRNQMSGPLPVDMGNLGLLNALSLAFNNFSGTVPDILFMLESIQVLDLRGNQFDAVNSNALGSSYIQELYLGRNAFEGEMPDAFGTLYNIQVLDLSHNDFTGKVPESFSNLYPKRVYLNDNHIDTLPDLSYWYGVMLNVQNNNLTFEFLVDLYTNGVIAFAAPQSPIGEFVFEEYIQGQDYSFTVETPGEKNEYQWWKNGLKLSGATSATLSIADASPADTGFYFCYVQNPDVPGLSLRTRPTVLASQNIPMADLLQGQVTDSLGNFVESGYVYLYQDTTKVKSPRIDSVLLQSEGYFNFKDFPKGKYRVKVMADKQRYPSFWPTYYPDKVSWEDGDLILVTKDTTLNVNVTVVGVPILTSADGDGEVNGNISFEGETKGSKGKPVREATVVLIGKDIAKDGGTFVAMVTTDADGNYTITNVPDGNYSMLVDIPGLSQISTYDVTISSNKIADKDFVITTQGIEASNTSSIEQPVFELVEFKAWPNPVQDYLKIQTLDAGIKRIEIISILGQKVADEVYPSMEAEITVNVSGLNPGLYFVRMHSTKGLGLKKIVVR